MRNSSRKRFNKTSCSSLHRRRRVSYRTNKKKAGQPLFTTKTWNQMWECNTVHNFYKVNTQEIVLIGIMIIKNMRMPVYRTFCVCKETVGDKLQFRIYYNAISLRIMMTHAHKSLQKMTKTFHSFITNFVQRKLTRTKRASSSEQSPLPVDKNELAIHTNLRATRHKEVTVTLMKWTILGIIMGIIIGSGAVAAVVVSGGSFAPAFVAGTSCAYSGEIAGIMKGMSDSNYTLYQNEIFRSGVKNVWRYRSRYTYKTIDIDINGKLTPSKDECKICTYAVTKQFQKNNISGSNTDPDNVNKLLRINSQMQVQGRIKPVSLSFDGDGKICIQSDILAWMSPTGTTHLTEQAKQSP